ncbi:hypothetical protein [Gordonia polyisoprenivorans]|uniref:hypothetical protein n=1 Tax=Gordonia polyisoprenivorans TaxID=84595 RepID=UPI001056C41E|nr:hypothetical protein [Gordonia polyisoprenivorans]MBE7191945.1 hypothetical protein [Gordonia polyisoprenivorans]
MTLPKHIGLTAIGVGVLGAVAVGPAAAATPAPGTEATFVSVSTTAETATITLTAPPLMACTGPLIAHGTPADITSTAWTGPRDLLSYSTTLADTDRFRGVAQQQPEIFGTRTKTVDLDAGPYVLLIQCTPYTADGDFAGDDTNYHKAFVVGGPSNPTNPTGPGSGAWGSLENVLP